MYQTKSHRHDSINDYDQFTKDMKVLTGMLYSIVTLKAFFPSKSPAKNADLAGGPAPYPLPLQKAGDKE
jgi:hypothetical protein